MLFVVQNDAGSLLKETTDSVLLPDKASKGGYTVFDWCCVAVWDLHLVMRSFAVGMSNTSSEAQADSFFASDTPQITDEVETETANQAKSNGIPVSKFCIVLQLNEEKMQWSACLTIWRVFAPLQRNWFACWTFGYLPNQVAERFGRENVALFSKPFFMGDLAFALLSVYCGTV